MNDISTIVGNLANPFYQIFFRIFFVNFFGSGSITGWTILISSLFSKLVSNEFIREKSL